MLARTNIAVTIGDPAGIGPEIVAHLFSGWAPERSRAVLIGAPAAFGPWREHFGLDCPVLSTPVEIASRIGAESSVVILDTGVDAAFPIAEESRGGGLHAGRAIELACELARNGSVAGIVTAPISKKSLNLGDFHFPGHTEMLARYLNAPDCQMMMVYRSLRVIPLTRHVPLRDVAGRISGAMIATCVQQTHDGLQRTFEIGEPRIAVAGLNPHAGDSGVIGTEEDDVIAPALAELRVRGFDVTGPMPADAMFQAAYAALLGERSRGYDAYIVMYHDQGLVPFKMLAQRHGVNVTIGLPVIRTSVDHGSAYDIAGQGVAETDSLLEAYMLAEQLGKTVTSA